MAYSTFGNTWWGERWLDALHHIDYSNRLARGMRYARNGSVKKIIIEEPLVSASVQGSRNTPYKVVLKANQFGTFEKTKLIALIQSNPYYLSQLHAGFLPKQLLQVCNNEKIQLFPSSWKDLSMQCSCPDWAVPCKHLAAVIYLLANEIDKDPFLIFRLHGLDLKKELLDKKQTFVESIPSFQSLTEPKDERPATDMLQLDFHQVPDMLQTFEQALPPNPLFCPDRDFRHDFLSFIKAIAKAATTFVTNLTFPEQPPQYLYSHCTITYKQHQYSGCLSEGRNKLCFSIEDMDGLLTYLQSLPLSTVEQFPPALQVLLLTHNLTLALLEKRALVPQILSIKADTYCIRWIPTIFNPEIRSIADSIAKVLGGEPMIFLGKTALARTEQILQLVSLFATTYMRLLLPEADTSYSAEHASFFSNAPYQPMKFSQRGNPSAISNWLGRLFLGSGSYHPVICLTEQNHEQYLCEIQVQHERTLPVSLSSFLASSEEPSALLRDISLLGTYLPAVDEALQGSGSTLVQGDSFLQTWFSVLPVLKTLGVILVIPKTLKKVLTPTLSIRISSSSIEQVKSLLSLKQLLNLSWTVCAGEEICDTETLKQMMEAGRRYVRFRDQYIQLDEKEMNRISKSMAKQPNLSAIDLLKAHLAGEYAGQPVITDESVRTMFASLLQVEHATVPQGLNAELRPYQMRGYQWLVHNHRLGLGSILADDMGLGKTIQVISLLVYLAQAGIITVKKPALIIVPASLISNWLHEISHFAPILTSYVHHGEGRSEPGQALIHITTYATLRRDVETFSKRRFSVLVLDEAQNIKNRQTSQTQAVSAINSDWSLALTGTPVENRLDDFYSILDVVMKGYLGSQSSFRQQFSIPIERYHDTTALQTFRAITSPLMLRRMKTDKSIINDLPEKLVTDCYANLTLEQKILYQQIVEQTQQRLEQKDGIAQKGAIFALLTALKQVCCHPALYIEESSHESEASGKTQILLGLLQSILCRSEKVLIFTQYARMGFLLQEILKTELNIESPFLHGGSSLAQRKAMVDSFQNDPNTVLMILSIRAGGTGLNLTAASHVIHYDLWWNPAVENQATDRAFRIGQDKQVTVHRLITEGTFEEKINEMLQDKAALVEDVVAKGETWVTELSPSELKSLITLREDHVQI